MPPIAGQTHGVPGSQPLARRHSPCPLSSSPSVHHLLHPLSLAAGLPPPVLPPSLSSLCPPSSLWLPLLAATHLAPLPPYCGSRSRSLGLFVSLSVPCPGWPALSCAVVGQTAQTQCSLPPSSLSTSGQFLIRVVAKVRPTGSSAHCRCGALASHMHHPCIAPAQSHMFFSCTGPRHSLSQ